MKSSSRKIITNRRSKLNPEQPFTWAADGKALFIVITGKYFPSLIYGIL